jgi:CubicO group peptidase (beta-lactamase class C family)
VLDGATAALERGRDDGYHLGAQLAVRMARSGADVLDAHVVVGDAAVGQPMTAGTLLPWFSCTKVVTAVAVLQQWERGALSLDDAVARHVPEFAAQGKERVTIRHLLTHTAGLRIAGGGLWRLGWDEALAAVCAAPLVDPGWVPGERAAYDAAGGFHVLGEVVRRADGRAFDAYVSEEVFEPLDMPDSWMALTPERFAAYRGDGRIGVMYDTTTKASPSARPGYDDGRALRRVMPSGSGVGPMRDLVRLVACLGDGGELDGHRLLGAAVADDMAARHRAGLVDETFGMVIDWGLGLLVNSFHYRGRPTSYGFGKHASRRAAGHGGSQSSLAFFDPAHGLAVALCCNGLPGEPGNHRRTQPVLTALYEDLGLAGG